MNPFRQFQQEFRAARYLRQADALEVQGKVWLTQAELWAQTLDGSPLGTPELIAQAHNRGKHLIGWAGHLRTEAAELKGDQS